jgi:DNA-directed RNA polymerase specialized sigma24 family protein
VPLFPDTHRSAVDALASPDEPTRARATEFVMEVYRGPIIAVLRHRFGLEPADAEDLAHDFLTQALAKEWLQRYDPSRARFRTFLRSCLAAFASTAHEAAQRLKRGGGAIHVPIDVATAAVTDPEVDGLFDREWVRSILTLALDGLQAECSAVGRQATWEVFMAREVEGAESGDPPSYEELATRFGLPATQVTNYLAWARPRFRSHVLQALRALTGSESEFRAEARSMLGVELP